MPIDRATSEPIAMTTGAVTTVSMIRVSEKDGLKSTPR